MPIYHNWEVEYKNLSIQELENKLTFFKKIFYFNSKEEMIDNAIKVLFEQGIIYNQIKEADAIIKILKEKTGKDYNYENKDIEISANDLIDYLPKYTQDIAINQKFKQYFKNLSSIDEYEKIELLLALYKDKEISINKQNPNDNLLDRFLSEINITKDIKETYNKFYKEAITFTTNHNLIG